MFLFLTFWSTQFVSGQEPVSLKDHTFLYVSPEFRIWVNVASFMRLSFLTVYRFGGNGIDVEISGETLGFSVVYGKFKMTSIQNTLNE